VTGVIAANWGFRPQISTFCGGPWPSYNVTWYTSVSTKWHLISDNGFSTLMYTELHWLDVPDRVKYKLDVLMYRCHCQHKQAPRYLMDHCSPVSDTVFRQHLGSASSHQLSVLRYQISMYGCRAFSVAGPTVWNSLPDDLRDPECFADSYRQSLQTFQFLQY